MEHIQLHLPPDTCVETCAITTKSADGKYRLEMQADGNLVIYDNNNTAIWSSGTAGAGFGTPYKTIMQNDGNLVLYDKNDNALWSSQTAGYGVSPYKAMIQIDGNLVVYDKNSLALWSSMNGKNTSLWNFMKYFILFLNKVPQGDISIFSK